MGLKQAQRAVHGVWCRCTEKGVESEYQKESRPNAQMCIS
jgi:hypothetical protein